MVTTRELIADGWPAADASRFKRWLDAMAEAIERRTNGRLDMHSMPDWHFADTYECGHTPDEAATMWLSDMEA